MKRDDVIRQVAAAVGEQHSVDLEHYDRLILVEIYRVRHDLTTDSDPEGTTEGMKDEG